MDPMRVEQKPPKPLLIFDGDCGFCRAWIARWKAHTQDLIDYAPYQKIAGQFPEIPLSDFQQAVQLIEPDGDVSSGAEAVFRALAYTPRKRWMLWSYQHIPGMGAVCRGTYRFVASHRRSLSTITRWTWGKDVMPASYVLSRWLFLRLLGVIYLIAFLSLGSQILTLAGSQGIVPAADYLSRVQQHLGESRYWSVPTLFWWDMSDRALQGLCWTGAGLSALLMVGIAPVPVLVLLWVGYLSLTNVGGVFLHFQWDHLLLETGFLAIFLAPWSVLPRPSREKEPSRIALFLLRWLLFRLMFLSGAVKLASGDTTWHTLTALELHYLTQPLPIWTSWYAHHLPAWFHKLSCTIMFIIELVVPVFIFGPRRLRHVACGAIVGFMVLIAATGNYCFFNLLTVALCTLLLDDAFLSRWIPGRRRDIFYPIRQGFRRTWPRTIIHALLALVVIPVSTVEGIIRLRGRDSAPPAIRDVMRAVAPFGSINAYGLFSIMTTQRHEIVIEGSDDGQVWKEYEFHWKPGRVDRPPGFVQPHQPRVDWQMWFAALGDYRRNPWLTSLMHRLLEGSPPVLRLFENNPFPAAPPRYVRAVLYDYQFTDGETKRKSGAWWQRQRLGLYCPPLSRRTQ